MQARRLRLDMDHSADPIWVLIDGDSNCSHAMVALDTLPLTQQLKARLRRWADEWESWNTDDKLLDDSVPSDAQLQAWERQGHRLALEVQNELGAGYEVAYGLPERL